MFQAVLSKCKFEESLDVQSNEKSYPCDQCLMSFSHHTLLKKHLEDFLVINVQIPISISRNSIEKSYHCH